MIAAREGGALELSVVNPVAVLGPVLGPDTSHSVGIVKQLLSGGLSGCPKVYSPYVDVRDVAALHLQAMIHPAANGERLIASAPGAWSMADIGRVLRRRMNRAGARVPTRELPNWLVRVAAPVRSMSRDPVSPRVAHKQSRSPRDACGKQSDERDSRRVHAAYS